MTSRFHLEHALAAWRRSLEHNPAFSADDLDELEQHLRDQVAGLAAEGYSLEVAYYRAIYEMGDYAAAEVEYRKVYWGKRRRRRELINELRWRLSMFSNYLKIAFRTLAKHRGYSFINIAGLGVGMACCILILLYVDLELSYDRFHEHRDDLYRVQMDRFEGREKIFSSAVTFPMVGPTLADEMPEVIAYARLLPTGGVMRHGDAWFREENIFFADSTFFELLSYSLQVGDPARVLTEPNAVVLSATTARRYFGDDSAIGKELLLDGETSYTVTGVFADVPANSHLTFDALLSFSTLIQRSPNSQTSWGWYDFYTYVQVAPGVDPAVLEGKMTDFMARHKAESYSTSGRWETLLLQPIADIHLHSRLSWEAGVNGNATTVYFLLVIALFILLIAWVNFINLSTARSLERAREVGVRKAVGAPRNQLVQQFLFESLLVNALAAILALVLALALQSIFSDLAGAAGPLRLTDHPGLVGLVLVVFMAGAFLSGLYPAFFLSSFMPVSVLKGKEGFSKAGIGIRKGLVVFQFTASIVLIAGTLLVVQQLDYLRGLDLGLNIEQTLVIEGPTVLPDREDTAGYAQVFCDALMQISGVQAVATASTVPGKENFWISSFRSDRMDEADSKDIYIVGVDADFLEIFDAELLAGRFFSEEFGADENAFILNETAARLLGFDTPEEALTGRIVRNDEHRPIIGVIRDYHQGSLKKGLDPVLFYLIPDILSYVTLKVTPQNLDETLAVVGAVWQTVFPGNPFEYFFLDDFFDLQYQADRRFGNVFGLFALLAILVACLGLFGLAAFSVQQRTKEIGVRKVLGANVPDLVALLSKDFLKLVGIAFIVAIPVIYFVMNRWLEDFAYRIAFGPGVFAAAGGLALLIALLTVSYQTVKAALADPVESLRYE